MSGIDSNAPGTLRCCVSLRLAALGALGYADFGHHLPGRVAEDYGWFGHSFR